MVSSLQNRQVVLEELIRTIDRKLQDPNLPAADREKLLKQKSETNAELALIPGRLSAARERLKKDEADLAVVIPLVERAKQELAARLAELDAAKAGLFGGLAEGQDQVFFSVEGTYALLKRVFLLQGSPVPIATCALSYDGSSVRVKLSDGIYPVQATLTVRYSHWNDYTHRYDYQNVASTITPANGGFSPQRPGEAWGFSDAWLEYVGVSGGCH